MFDRPLFTVGRDSNLRRLCQTIVLAKYEAPRIDLVTGLSVQLEYKQIHSLLGELKFAPMQFAPRYLRRTFAPPKKDICADCNLDTFKATKRCTEIKWQWCISKDLSA